MTNLLTDRTFWENYWESKTDIIQQIPANHTFHQQLEKIISERNVKSAIELGGFPGYYAVFLKKYFNLNVALLDYFIHPSSVNALLKENGLNETDVELIEADLFSYQPEKQYDLVLSCGLIEHFNDTEDIVNRHIPFLKPGGTLLITLPNFKSVNGWFQKNFDAENYNKHNIASMDIVLLKEICEKAGLKDIKVNYYGRFSVWFENEQQKPKGVRLLKKIVWLAGKVFTKIVPFDSKGLSPYIVLEAKKP
ncbi:MAG TPA: class I SAM-dependent methyltransferase [Pelobium sp.]|nr:class I SAM-dependent methyltransferase [Pelobium sp.]